MADHRGALRAVGPVSAGPVLAWRKGPAVSLCPSQNVMSVRYVVDTGDHGAAPLEQGRLLGELVVVAVQIIDVLRDRFALEVLPRAIANAVTRVDSGFSIGSLRAEIGVPVVF